MPLRYSNRWALIALWTLFLGFAMAGKRHHYEEEEAVPFEVNKMGPYANPSETYEYYSLAFCRPDKIQHKHSSLGEDFSGDHKYNSKYDVRFKGKA